jgi:hypothetical protein
VDFPAQSADQFPDIFRDRRAAGLAAPDFPGPEEAEAFTVPGDYSFRLDDDEGGAPIGPNPGQAGPERAISGGQLRPLHRALEYAKLVAQSEDLELKGRAAAEQRQPGREECGDHNGGRGSAGNGQLAFYQSDPDFREPQVPRSSSVNCEIMEFASSIAD